MITDHLCTIISNTQSAPDCYEMIIKPETTEFLQTIQPGQFLQVKINNEFDPLLRRPFSIFRLLDDSFSILYAVVGRGTKDMSSMPVDHKIKILGPLGNGFNMDLSKEHHICIAGGIGIAPFLLLCQKLINSGIDPQKIHLLFGARNKNLHVGLQSFQELGIQCQLVSDDGSSGRQGFVTDLLKAQLDNSNVTTAGYCCGPTPMFKAVQTLIKDYPEFPCQFSLESAMACGLGVCNVCIIKHHDHPDGFLKTCKDGPVFDGKKLEF